MSLYDHLHGQLTGRPRTQPITRYMTSDEKISQLQTSVHNNDVDLRVLERFNRELLDRVNRLETRCTSQEMALQKMRKEFEQQLLYVPPLPGLPEGGPEFQKAQAEYEAKAQGSLDEDEEE